MKLIFSLRHLDHTSQHRRQKVRNLASIFDTIRLWSARVSKRNETDEI